MTQSYTSEQSNSFEGGNLPEGSVFGTIPLHVRMGDSRVQIILQAVGKVAVPVLLEISFPDRFVEWIFPPKQNIAPYNFKRVAIPAM